MAEALLWLWWLWGQRNNSVVPQCPNSPCSVPPGEARDPLRTQSRESILTSDSSWWEAP